MSLKASKEAGLKLIDELNLTDVKSNLIHKLSGGMLRRLSLAIAFIGDPKVSHRSKFLELYLTDEYHMLMPNVMSKSSNY